MYIVQFSESETKTSVYYFTKNRKQHIKMQCALYRKQNRLYTQEETNAPMFHYIPV